jgi:zinc D-Ala-D-Ala carboxypeptidase
LISTETYEKQIAEILRALGIAEKYRNRLPVSEATDLVSVGADVYGREQKLAPNAAAAWQKMNAEAGHDGIVLLLVSAFRSVAYQQQIIERKLAAGQTMDQILCVSAAPGFSEHHTGRALDVTAPNCKPLTEEFERTVEFNWLSRRAKDFGFTMSYPRDNKFGVIYEPWHWMFHDSVV